MRFEWGEAKSRINQAKPDGLDFETAARVFNDPQIVLAKDCIAGGRTKVARDKGGHESGSLSRAYLS